MNTAVIESTQYDVAIIGAGTAGCMTANLLSADGYNCCIIEKSRGLGGRCSRRRIEGNESIDLGASEFSMDKHENPLLQEKIDTWVQAGYLSRWKRPSSRFDKPSHIESKTTLCATPFMNSWHKKMVNKIPILTSSHVSKLTKTGKFWQLLDDNKQLICTANNIVITSPPEQAADLIKGFNGFSRCKAAADTSLPQYVCAIGFSQSLPVKADSYQDGHPVLQSAIRESHKLSKAVSPDSLPELWVLHSTHHWAKQHSEQSHQQAAVTLSETFCQHFKLTEKPRILSSHYWRLARHQALPHPYPSFIWNEELQIGCVGDWLDSGDFKGALNSSLGLSQRLSNTHK